MARGSPKLMVEEPNSVFKEVGLETTAPVVALRIVRKALLAWTVVERGRKKSLWAALMMLDEAEPVTRGRVIDKAGGEAGDGRGV